MSFPFWLVSRFMRASRGVLSLSTGLSLLGLVIGVASLVVAMAVVSGYETTLRKSVIDLSGHLMVADRSGENTDFRELLREIPDVEAYTPFVFLEAVLAHQGKLSGVLLEGVDEATVHQVLQLRSRLQSGEFRLRGEDGRSAALIGKGLARKHGLKVGDEFKVVLPVASEFDRGSIRPRVSRFKVKGILNLGRDDFDNRYILTDLKTAQQFAQMNDRVMGHRFRVKSDEGALLTSRHLEDKFGHRYVVKNWRQTNENLFEAVRLEKPVIFLVLMMIVVAASFNISSTLLVSVIRRFRDIGVLKAMGAGRRLLMMLFSLQGVVIGVVGSVLGVVLGYLGCWAFVWAQDKWDLLPSEVYHLDRVVVEVRGWDLAAIVGASLLICFISTLGPARRGANLPPVEGLRYE